MTANQVVALNLRFAREDREWTQEMAALELEPYLGERWSKASFSSAERSADEDATRKREFDANELLAFAAVFEKPIAWFFTLPPDVDDVTCGDEFDVTRHVGRRELEQLTPVGDVAQHEAARTLRETAQTLNNVAADLERGEPTTKPKGRKDMTTYRVRIIEKGKGKRDDG